MRGKAVPARPTRVGDLLAAAVPGLRERMVEWAVRGDWADIAGTEVARHSRPVALRQGVLHVTVDNSPWLCELTLRTDDLLGRVRSRCGDAVASLRFSLGERLPAPPAVTRQRAPRPVALSAEDGRSVDAITASVSDPALAASLRRLVTKDLIARRRRDAATPSREGLT